MIAIFIGFLFSFYTFCQEISIVAIVDNEPITTLDIKNRAKIFNTLDQSFAKLDATSQNKMISQTLIQEGIKNAYARRIDLKASDNAIAAAVHHVKQNHTDLDLSESLQNFIKTEIIWHMIIERHIAPNIQIPDAEIANVQKLYPAKSKDEITNSIFQLKLQNATRDFISKASNTIYFEVL